MWSVVGDGVIVTLYALLMILGGVVAVLCVWVLLATVTGRRDTRWMKGPSGWRGGATYAIVLVAALAAVWVGWVNANAPLARTTLFEVDAMGSEGVRVGDPAPVPTFDVVVEHPGIEHSISVVPDGPPLEVRAVVVELRFTLLGPDGQTLIDEQVRHEPKSCRRSACWRSWEGTFTPVQAGPHRLTLVIVNGDVPFVHIRVEDPAKTDGERAPRYG